MFGTDGAKFVRHRVGTRYHPRHRLPTVKSGSSAVTIYDELECEVKDLTAHHEHEKFPQLMTA
ncbi:hypothetical protein TELCIR_12707 [Teladorsagia circumcincta]|uniref:Uncharacterized protein n=1 Tax=Teladorsagia circumcincta TaxID=45464 RepID=A0A2G9U604_TELCI|nr:hypothetical protein TELCIR_12707 [Teladorsagia circumcincta]